MATQTAAPTRLTRSARQAKGGSQLDTHSPSGLAGPPYKVGFASVALTIAGSDPSGGAGIQADLKTFAALEVWGYSAITSVIAQSSARVARTAPVSAQMVAAQIAAIADERRPDAVKTGALANASVVETVARTIASLKLPAPVVDPVLVSSSGTRLLDKAGEAALRSRLIPLARLVTPNIPEARALSGVETDGIESMREAARALRKMGARAVVIKGGHLGADTPALDLFYDGRVWIELKAERIRAGHKVHGTGCLFSAAIAAYLARGEKLEDSVRHAKGFLMLAMRRQIKVGRGRAMLNPFALR
jgi:hydroxymethylpyrimidine/phosphomethylpyrimidine kinase